MKKRLLFIAAFAATLFVAHGQTTPAQTGDQISFNGYTIHLQKTPAGGYIYDILSRSNIIIHHNSNPFTGSQNGLMRKEDAVKAAKWEVIHISPVTGKPILNSQKLSAEIAKQLNISLE